ncbi:hypothetical protein [Achromobacter sp. Root83]|uniref:hypothetical protein n=1 Tax=Achromobacter sp. Root83 TaxID=1736602 RepID=UPI0035142A55
MLDAISRGTFSYATIFPDSKNAAKFSPKALGQTLQAYLENWVDAKAKTIKASTADGYRKAVNGRLVPSLGKHELADLRRAHVREMCEDMDVTN